MVIKPNAAVTLCHRYIAIRKLPPTPGEAGRDRALAFVVMALPLSPDPAPAASSRHGSRWRRAVRRDRVSHFCVGLCTRTNPKIARRGQKHDHRQRVRTKAQNGACCRESAKSLACRTFSGLFGFRIEQRRQGSLGLQRLEGSKGAEKLRQRRAAVAHQRVQRAGATRQRKPERALHAAMVQAGALRWRPSRAASRRSARRARHAATTMRATRSACSAPSGASSLCSAASKAPKAAAFSSTSSIMRFAQRPCLVALRATRARPAAVLGPRDFAPLRRLAAARAAETFGMADDPDGWPADRRPKGAKRQLNRL